MIDRKDIEAIYPLTPMQEAMLLQSLQDGASNPGFLQMTCSIEGDLDEGRFRAAWEWVIRRHAALRTSLHWQDLERPLQIVHRIVDLPWRSVDLRSEANPLDAWQRLIEEDCDSRFDLSKAPVLRVTIARTGDASWMLLWTCHHALIDGWSGGLVFNEVLAAYEKLARDEALTGATPRPFREYVLWLQGQELSAAEAHWRRALQGFVQPTPLPARHARNGAHEGTTAIRFDLDRATTEALQQRVRTLRVMHNTLFQGAWAMALSRLTGERDVLYGTTDSGRTADLPGIESMVGLFINTVPVRVQVDEDLSFADFLQRLQREQLASRPYASVSPAQVQAWSEVPVRERLYESLLVVQNYPRPTDGAAGTLKTSGLQGGFTSAYPVTVAVVPGEEIAVHVLFDATRCQPEAVQALADSFRAVLVDVAADPDRPVQSIGARSGRPMAAMQTAASVGPRSRPSMAVPFVAPADVLETQLAEIWGRTLGIDSVGIDDDFFDLGGHSLLVGVLVDDVERTVGRRLPLATFIRTTTVRELARHLRDDGWTPPWSSLVPMQPDGDRPPLFCIHSWTGDVLHFRHLARLMAPDYPVYGLQAAGLGSGVPEHDSVEAMAAHYIREIRSVFPKGPYALAGLCFGMKVAVEMARQLKAESEDVAALFVLDTGVTLTDPSVTSRLGHYLRRGREGIRDLGVTGFARTVVQRRVGNLKKKLGATKAADPHERFAAFVRATRAAWLRHELQPYAGPITFVRSSGWAGERKRDWQIPMWERIAGGGLRIVVVPGRHARILKPPHVVTLAEHLKAELDKSAVRRTNPPAVAPQAKPEEQVA
ncbi:MAG TPA: condensation domain-containing protein [Rhodothermales bacterium]